MGHFIQKSNSMQSGTSTKLLHCLQEMSAKESRNTCYTAGELESEILYETIIKYRLSPALFLCFPFLPTDEMIIFNLGKSVSSELTVV